jgi:hypothetical protein
MTFPASSAEVASEATVDNSIRVLSYFCYNDVK